MACFTIHQVYAWKPGFDRNNLTRWLKKGYLLRLRQGYFAFPEYKGKHDYTLYFANRIYRPSYISLHTALAFYGIIPEAVVQVTSITSLKTASFINDFGEYSYLNVKERLMFGYELKPVADQLAIQYATAEKALLDLLYLYPFYNTVREVEALRLDEDYLHNELKKRCCWNTQLPFKARRLTAG
ncbi:MAG: hypothetical protein QM763_23400 [Agriterribacter sp.]